MCVNLLLVSVTSVFYARHCIGLRTRSLLDQLGHTFPNLHLRCWTIPVNLPIARPSLSVLRVQMPTYPRSGFFPRARVLSAAGVFAPVVFLDPLPALGADAIDGLQFCGSVLYHG